jgi:hypothetical protein
MASPKKRYWTAYNYIDGRNAALAAVEQAIQPWAFITDYRMFSDMVLTLTLEVAPSKVADLHAALSAVMVLDDSPSPPSEASGEIEIHLHVTFVKGSGDVRHVVPAVPG